MTAPAAQTGAGNVTSVAASASPVSRCLKPGNTSDGDVLWALVYTRDSGPLCTTIPPGWSLTGPNLTSNGTFAVYWKYIKSAAAEGSYYTWRSPNGAGRNGVIIGRITGCPPPTAAGSPIDNGAGGMVAGGTTTIAAPSISAAATGTLLVAFYKTDAVTTTPPVITAPAGMTEVAALPIVGSTAASYLEVAARTLTAPGPTGTETATVAPAAADAAGFLVTFAPAGHGTPAPPVLVASLSGGVTDTQATIAYVTRFVTTGVRVAVSTSPALTGPVYSTAAVPDSSGIGKATITGLTAATTYYYAVELDGALDSIDVGTFTTLPATGTAASFCFTAASCAQNDSNAATFTTIRNWTGPATGQKPSWFVNLGDDHYQDIGTNDQGWAVGAWLNALTAPNRLGLYRAMPLVYTWSDHDSGGPNDDDSEPALPAVQAGYRELFPSFPIAAVDGAGIYQTWKVGRVRFVMTDGRSYMSPIANVDNSSKSKLGATQKVWFKSQITQGDVCVIWIHEDAWNGAVTYGGDDTWTAYQTERTELAAFIQANQVPIYYIHGDYHCLGCDDGSHSPGGFPIACCSPSDQSTFNGNGTFSGGFWPVPATGSTIVAQFGGFEVIDDGTQVIIRYYGVASGVTQLYQESSFGRTRHIGWGAPL